MKYTPQGTCPLTRDRNEYSDSPAAPSSTHRAAELARALNSSKTLAVQVSTDASKRKGTTAGLGWVIDFQHADPRNKLTAPRLGFDLREARSILEAELHAISTGLKKAISWCNGMELQLTAADITPTFVVRSDSQVAIHLLDGTLSQDAVGSKNVDTVLTELKSIAQRHPVEFTWVRGHNGDQGNEFADRLAVFARRTHESAIEPERQQQTFEVIRRDYLATR
ncbi:ribonuclease HI [Neomicrococcus aestuarii]|uniref:Ribonuclease HI n=1 Tax=Neomicrococcus aestuarii TaxID=556325 RepID=A0A7W8TVH3_9MICC|nr:RNase H family protein [Neomicrococcus aestuarii]MBB5512860.1 ribonuclease HI [Neomicrococcus aestuarii]